MNVFEDLLTDLKEENLLEDTVLEQHIDPNEFDDGELNYELPLAPVEEGAVPEVIVTGNDAVATEQAPSKPSASGREFFKKRAIAEVSSLQMVEHVLTGVEREYMKIKPRVFDDLKAKLALNKFIRVSDQEIANEEHKTAEFEMMQETEAWCSALAERDSKVHVSSLRQYCENTKPALSSQALLALCRFYRNLPYSESTRSKYDFLLTRLFTRAAADDQRVCLFKRDEALKHLESLYKDWSSVSLYAADDDDSKVMLTAMSFDDLALESQNASNFDQLIESDFFGRLRMFKESIAELFFAPQVAIAALEANVRIGNSYVKLLAAERQKMDADSIQAKYSSLDQDSVSDATARTLQLVESLKAPSFDESDLQPDHEPRHEVVDRRPDKAARATAEASDNEPKQGFVAGMVQNAFAVNKWLLAGSILLIAASIGIYIWANYVVDESASSASVHQVSQDNQIISEHVKTAKISGEILYGLLDASWDAMPKEKRVEYVQRLLAQGPTLGFTQVNLTAKDGKPAAYASKDKIEVQAP